MVLENSCQLQCCKLRVNSYSSLETTTKVPLTKSINQLITITLRGQAREELVSKTSQFK